MLKYIHGQPALLDASNFQVCSKIALLVGN